MFDLGDEPPPPSFYDIHYAFLAVSFILPFGYWFLCRRMAATAIPKRPTIPYFCAFGSVGGYFLISGLSPSLFTLLAIPFLPLAILSLIASLVYVLCCRPFTRYHCGAAIA